MNRNEIIYKFGDKNSASNPESKKLAKDYYDGFYENNEFPYYDERTTRRFLKVLLRKGRVARGGDILDVGCGTAFYTEHLHNIGFNATGIDISRVGILKGRSRYPSLSLIIGDASAMPFKHISFDALLMFGCSLTNTRDIQALQSYISSLVDYLKDGGVMILVGRSDLSGKTSADSEWIHHTYDEILNYVDRKKVEVDGPYMTNMRLISSLGRIAVNRFFSFLLKKFPGNHKWSFVYYIRRKKA